MTQSDLAVKMILDRWHGSISSLNKQLDALTDDQLMMEIAPGKNRGIYLLGHLIAVHDEMMNLLDLGDKLFPELREPFITESDHVATPMPSAAALRSMWTRLNDHMTPRFAALTTDDWFTRHTAVSPEDFQKEPHRNKLNIIVSRTSHLQYHTGQLVLLKNTRSA